MLKSLFIVALSLLGYFCSFSQESSILGTWEGNFKNETLDFNVFFNLKKDSTELECFMSVPAQLLKDVKASKVQQNGDSIFFSYSAFNASYRGRYESNTDVITGTWTQNGVTTLKLMRSDGPIEPERPQEPTAPFPYHEEDVVFQNEIDGFELAGTLTLPKSSGPFPAVVLVSGSGPQNRNSELMNHKPFLVISDFLTKKGIAVLRFDDRGVGESKGNFAGSTTHDFANDATAAIRYLQSRKEIDQKAIGVMGHSEGGMVAPIVGSRLPELGFVILLAAPAEHIPDMMVKQNSNIFETYGFDEIELQENEAFNTILFKLVASDKPNEELYDTIKTLAKNYYQSLKPERTPLFGPNEDVYYFNIASQIFSPWFRAFLKYNANEYLVQLNCPLLALNGSRDIQVPSTSNLNAIEKSLKESGHKDYTIVEFPELNHLFQKCETCTVQEYGTLKETFSYEVLETISDWIIKRF